MLNNEGIIFWMWDLFHNLKLLPCAFFLFYVMDPKHDHYRPVVREKEGQRGATTVWGFSCDVPVLTKGDWSLSQVTGPYPLPFSWTPCGI